MSNIIPFPNKQKITPNRSSVEIANERMKKRLGISIWEYLGFEGDRDEVDRKVNRAMQKETINLKRE